MQSDPSLEARVRVSGAPVRLSIGAGHLHVEGDFAGNVVVLVQSQPSQAPQMLVSQLKIRVNGDQEAQPPIAYDPLQDGSLEVTFHSPTVLKHTPLPTAAALLWGREKPREIGCVGLQPISE
ncbi:MAG: hypothetical protein ACREJ2_14565 [Planctomycetota bacterium]